MGAQTIATSYRPTSDLLGIGDSRAQDLAAFGYHTCEDLLGADPSIVAEDLDLVDGVTRAQVLDEYIPQAKLFRLPLTVDDAIALFDHGFRSYEQLLWLPPAAFTDSSEVEAALAALDVARRVDTGTVTLKVYGSDGTAMSGATVEAVNPTKAAGPHAQAWTTTSHGTVLCEYLRPGLVDFVLFAAGHAPRVVTIDVQPNGYTMIRVDLASGDGSNVVVDETETGVSLPEHGVPVDRVVLTDPASLASDAFIVTSGRTDVVRLTSAKWRQEGATIIKESAKYPATEVPDTTIGSVVSRSTGSFQVVAPNWRDWRIDQRSIQP